MRLRPILPKKAIIEVRRIDVNVHRDLRAFGVDIESKMERYPPALPWKSRPPKRGLRKGIRRMGVGKRTGRLAKGWAGALRMSRFKVEVVNPVSYGVYVQGRVPGSGKGRRQTAVMRARGWQNITSVSKATWPKYRLRIQKSIAGK